VVSTEVERYDGVDEADVPSAKWGWSKINHRTWHIVGFLGMVFLLCMLRGNHVGHVEDIFLICFAVLVAVVLIRDMMGRKRGWIRD
jgi:cell division protein FtsW (lipid II flippase)